MRKALSVLAVLGVVVCAIAMYPGRRGQASEPVNGELAFPTIDATDNRGFDVSNLDKSVSACTNFFEFANGGWVAKNAIPAAYPSWGRFIELADRNQDQLRQILEAASKNTNAKKGSNEQKIGDYYASCMDEPAIEAAGLTNL